VFIKRPKISGYDGQGASLEQQRRHDYEQSAEVPPLPPPPTTTTTTPPHPTPAEFCCGSQWNRKRDCGGWLSWGRGGGGGVEVVLFSSAKHAAASSLSKDFDTINILTYHWSSCDCPGISPPPSPGTCFQGTLQEFIGMISAGAELSEAGPHRLLPPHFPLFHNFELIHQFNNMQMLRSTGLYLAEPPHPLTSPRYLSKSHQ